MLYVYTIAAFVSCLLGLRLKLGALLIAVLAGLLAAPVIAIVEKLTLTHALGVAVLLQVCIQSGYFLGILLRTKFDWRQPKL